MKNPKRVAAGRRNRALRGELTEAGRLRLREAALRGRAWEASTGPVTEAGKAQARANGKRRQIGDCSIRELRRELAESLAFRRSLDDLKRLGNEAPDAFTPDRGGLR